MDLTSINSLSAGGSSILSASGGSFGENPFLELLVTQMRSQTPTDPVDNTSFMQQMSAMSSMEQQQELNSNMLQLLDYQGLLARLQGLSEGSALLGREVTFADPQTGQDLAAVVESVYVNEEGEVRIKAGDYELGLRDVSGIRVAEPTAQA